MTDSQDAFKGIEDGGRSGSSDALQLATLRETQLIRETGRDVKVIWIPGHSGVVGSELAHLAAQKLTTPETKAVVKPELRIRENAKVCRLLRKEVEADTPPVQSNALPGKHSLRLYGAPSHEDAGVLTQARTGHAYLNVYLARTKEIDSAACACEGGAESVKHVLPQCPMWAVERRILEEVAGDRWGDTSYLLGGKSRRRDPRTGKAVDGDKWRPNLDVVRATIAFLKSAGRFSSQVQNTIHIYKATVAIPITLAQNQIWGTYEVWQPSRV
ncbi:Hypothetical protein D9617_45g091270 [Elsinoe fawcettii]|nr:Hypothetical protein D9617_45g091270 [Elsinoe fawcettii]